MRAAARPRAIDDLVDTVRARRDGRPARRVPGVGPVDAVAGLTAYRVVQEALTNVLKHAGPCATNVASGYRRRCVRRDRRRRRARTAHGSNGGHGLVGMRERVSVLGGTLDAGAGTRGGFAVRARLAVVGMTIRVVVADDQELVRSGFAMILDAQDDIEVVGEADDGDTAVEVVQRLRPDVVLMDVRMPRMDGIEATRRLAGPGVADPVKVVILTTFDLDEYVFDGAAGGRERLPAEGPSSRGSRARGAGRRRGRRAARAVDHQAAHRGLRGPPVAGRDGRRLGAHTARAGGPRAHRARRQQHGDRRDAVRVRGDGEDARRPGPDEARPCAIACTRSSTRTKRASSVRTTGGHA